MGTYYLCVAGRARHPYHVESVGMNLWSLEELCYYMKENVYLLDETILNEKLADWIGEELGLEKLCKALHSALDLNVPACDLVLPIFQESGYLTEPELLYFREQLAQVQAEPLEIRKKKKADYLVDYGMYVRAIGEYEKILSRRRAGRIGTQFYASLLENMATAYARLFRFEEAADCLWESYSALRSRKVYEKYLRILPLFLPESRYRARLEEIHADRDHAAAMKADTAAILEEAKESAFAAEWDALPIKEQLEKLKRDYIKCTGN